MITHDCLNTFSEHCCLGKVILRKKAGCLVQRFFDTEEQRVKPFVVLKLLRIQG